MGRLFVVNWRLCHWVGVNQEWDKDGSCTSLSLSTTAWPVRSLSSLGKPTEGKSEKNDGWEAHTVCLDAAEKRSIWEVSAFHLNQVFLVFIFKQCLALFQIFLEEHSVLSCLMTNSYWWIIISGKRHMGYKGFQYCLCEYDEFVSNFPTHRIWE